MVERISSPRSQLAAVARSLRWPDRQVPLASAEHSHLRQSAVLIACTLLADDAPGVLLVQRSPFTRHHPGQFAFPGGGIDPGESPATAALRECYEESGLPVNAAQVVGQLPPLVLTASGNVVTPVLAWLDDPEAAVLPPNWVEPEIHDRFWVSIDHLTDPHNRATIVVQDRWSGPGFALAGGWVWGFTAIVLDELLTAVGWNRRWDRSKTHQLRIPPPRPIV